jgi:hypothetical protein
MLLVQKKCGVERVALLLDKYGRDFPELFQQISMIDGRPDTSRIGIVRTGRRGQNEVLFFLPVSQQLTGYLNATYSRPAGRYQLLVVLKDLWMMDHATRLVKGVYATSMNFGITHLRF